MREGKGEALGPDPWKVSGVLACATLISFQPSSIMAPEPSPPSDTFALARQRMVREQLERRGVRHPGVLESMGTIPREHFLTGSRATDPLRAYADTAIPVARGQTLSQPYMVARMTEALAPEPESRILEIGTGTGYQTAVLARLVAEVWSVERDRYLADRAQDRLEKLGLDNIHFQVGDGSLGWPDGAPYDGILVTAAAPSVPPALVAQLAPGGRLVIPVGPRNLQELLLVQEVEGEVRTQVLMECRFVPLVGQEGWSGPTA